MTSVKRDGLAILGAAKAKLGMATMDIIDIRCGHAELNLQKEVERMMNPINGPKELPTLLLYDEKGLQLFEDITYLDEYYLTNCEIDVLRRYATDMASKIPDGAVVVELGSGNLRKVCLLLQAFENAGKTIDYYALDLSQEELQRTLSQVPHFKHVSCHGLFGTYDDGRDWLAGMKDDRPRCILHMGSSIGNFTQAEAVDFLKQFSDVMKPQDLILIGVDSWNQPDKV
jgi:EasF-like predicted methyltransferase